MEEKKTDKMEQPLFTRPEGGEEDEVTIDWMALIRRIFAIRRKLYLAAAVGLLAGVIIALSIPKQYTVSVTLSPEMGSGKSGGGLASMAASFLGTSMGSDSPDALNATLAPDIVASTPFLLELFDARVRTADGKVDTTLVAYLDEQSAPWWSYILRAPGMAVGGIKSLLGGDKEELPADSLAGGSIELSEEEAGKLQSLRQSVLADVDKKTAITTLTVTLQDPKVTATVADSVVSKLQQYIIAYRTRKAKEDCRYLEQLYRERQAEYYEAQQRYAKYVDANSNVVFQSTLADGKVDTTLVAYLDEQSAPWWSYILRAPGMAVGGIKSLLGGDKEELPADSLAGGSIELSEEEAGKLQSLRQSVLADVDKKTAITTLTVTLQDPKVTATVADSVVSKLQQYIIAYRTRKAKEDCRYLEQLYRERQAEYYEAQQRYAKYVDANSNVVFQSTLAERERLQNDMSLAYQVYSQVAQQLQVARAKVQEEKPVFAVVEPAVVPREPSGTSRKVIVLGWIFLAVAGVAAWELLGKDYWQKFRSALS